MTDAELIKTTRAFIKKSFEGEGTSHDWWHMYRVEKLAVRLAEAEGGTNMLVVRLGAWLHDVADWKFHDGDFEAGPRAAREFLTAQGADPEIIKQVEYIVRHVSFRGGTNQHVMETIEGKVVQDADRLDAIGAIGIARTFTFGGAFGRNMYDPAHKPHKIDSFEDYKKQLHGNTTINHFYEKLLLLKDRLNTESARRFAQARHEFMEQFLDEFYAEWEGER